MQLIIFLKLTNKNIFVNIFEQRETKNVPVILKTLNAHKIENEQIKTKISNEERINDFVNLLIIWLQTKYIKINKLILVFNNFGNKQKKVGQTNYKLGAVRDVFIDKITEAELPIGLIIDKTNIPYGGCRGQRLRRKKRKHFPKINQ